MRIERQVAAFERQFDATRYVARNALFGALTNAGESGDPAMRSRCVADRHAFDVSGLLPASVPAAARVYESTMLDAKRRLIGAYSDEIRRCRKQSRDEDADRLENHLERRRDELAHLEERDLRCQIDPQTASADGGWSWRGTALTNKPATESPLRLSPTAGFPLTYALTVQAGLEENDAACQLAFPYRFADRRLLGAISIRRGQIDLHTIPRSDGDRSVKLAELPQDDRLITIRVEVGVVRVTVSDRELLVADLADLAPPNGSIAKSAVDPQTPWLLPSPGTSVQLESLRMLNLDRRTEAVPTGSHPAGPMAQGTDLTGTWKGGGAQDGICRTVEVRERKGDRAVVEVATNGGDVFQFHLRIKGRRISVEDVVRTGSSGRGATMAFSTVKGNGWITPRGFDFVFEACCRRPRKTEQWCVRIGAKLPRDSR